MNDQLVDEWKRRLQSNRRFVKAASTTVASSYRLGYRRIAALSARSA